MIPLGISLDTIAFESNLKVLADASVYQAHGVGSSLGRLTHCPNFKFRRPAAAVSRDLITTEISS